MHGARESSAFLVVLAVILVVPQAGMAVVDNADSLYVGPGENYTLGGTHEYNVLVQVAAAGSLKVAYYDGGASTGYVELSAPAIDIQGTVDGNERGFRRAEGPGSGNYPGTGGSYGGQGGASGWGNPAKPPYGTPDGPDIEKGSGGADQTLGIGGSGGAMVALYAASCTVSGQITVNGAQGSDVTGWGDGGGGGSGGGILIDADTANVSGALSANGGRGGNSVQRRGGGGGGGGRIKVFYCSLSFTGTHTETGGAGGIGGWPANGYPGDNGTYYAGRALAPRITDILDVGNDQGRFVRMTWSRSCADDPLDPDPVTHYDLWRRIDPLAGAAAESAEPPARLLYPPGDWDFVGTVPARGEDSYNCVVPTLADSNSSGLHMTTFFVSGVTANPFVYYDSAPDSGYSVDNLAPTAPTGLQLVVTTLTWDECPWSDFDYFTVYGSAIGNMSDAVLMGHTVSPSMDVYSSPHAWYLVTATDFNGNEGEPAVVQNTTTGAESISYRPSRYVLHVPRPNPSAEGTAVSFETPRDGRATLQIYDVTGRLVRTLLDAPVGPGLHTRVWTGRDAAGHAVSPGVYFVRLVAGDFAATSKLTRTE